MMSDSDWTYSYHNISWLKMQITIFFFCRLSLKIKKCSFAFISSRKKLCPEFIFSEPVGAEKAEDDSDDIPVHCLLQMMFWGRPDHYETQPRFPQLDWQFSFRANLEPLTSFSQRGVGGFGAGLYRVTARRGPAGSWPGRDTFFFFCILLDDP